MPEEQEQHGEISKEKTKLLFTVKRLSDVAKDFEKLSDVDEKFIIERVDKLNAIDLVELYNALGEYMK